MFRKLSFAERSSVPTPVERLGCRPYDESHGMPGRCYFYLENDLCVFPFASNWLKTGCAGGRGRHDPVKISNLSMCPLTHLGSAHLQTIHSPFRWVQRGDFRIPLRDGKLQWKEAKSLEDLREAEIRRKCAQCPNQPLKCVRCPDQKPKRSSHKKKDTCR